MWLESGAELVKHSYHITIANLVYACNHDKSMEKFFTLPSTSDFSAFHWTDAKGQSKCIVDLSVYTRNRVFRLPYNMKRSSTVPLRRVGDDPHAEDYNSEFNYEDVDDVLPMVLTRIEYCADTYVVPKEVGPDKVACTQRRAPLVNTLKPTRCKTDIGLPFAKEKLQQMLQEAGDLVSIVSTVTYKNESMWMAQCTKSCPRKCLINKNRIHPHNNCLLFVKKTTKSSARVEYKCMGSECRGLMGRCLGDIHWDDLEQELHEGTQETSQMVHETHQETSGAMEMVHETHQETSGAMEEEQLKRTTQTSQMVIKKHHRWLSRNITDGYQETSGAMEEEPRKQTLETSQMVRETHQETSGALEEEQHKQTLETPNVSCERPSEATEANSKKQTLETPNVSCERPSENSMIAHSRQRVPCLVV